MHQLFNFRIWSISEQKFLNLIDENYSFIYQPHGLHLKIDNKLVSSSEYTVSFKSSWKDKNGESIYSGDIVKLVNAAGFEVKLICQFKEFDRKLIGYDGQTLYNCDINGFCFHNPDNNFDLLPIKLNYLGVHDTSIMTIIGNIFETNNIH